MKYLGDIIAGIGFVGMILGFSSYDTNPVICGAVGVVGTLLIWIGYNVDKQTCKESKDDCYIKKDDASKLWRVRIILRKGDIKYPFRAL